MLHFQRRMKNSYFNGANADGNKNAVNLNLKCCEIYQKSTQTLFLAPTEYIKEKVRLSFGKFSKIIINGSLLNTLNHEQRF